MFSFSLLIFFTEFTQGTLLSFPFVELSISFKVFKKQTF